MSDQPLDLGGLLGDESIISGTEEVTEAVLDPNFEDDPESEFMPQETLDGITDQEEK